MLIYQSQRVFQLWKYHVSHRQLLLVSNPRENFVTRVELLFFGVQLINLKTKFNSLVVSEANSEQTGQVLLDAGFKQSAMEGKVFLLASEEFAGYVIALGFRQSEDSGNHTDPSKLYFEPKDLFAGSVPKIVKT
jgi:hypothetical protein